MKHLTFSFLFTIFFAFSVAGQNGSVAGDLPRQGYLGAQVAAVSPDTRTQLKLPEAQGVAVQRVDDASSAAEAGIKMGDIILKANDRDVNAAPAFVNLIRPLRAGQKVALTILRDGKQQAITVTLKPRALETSPDFDVLYRAVNTSDGRRRVIITKPKAAGKYPAVLMVGGIGCYSLDNFPPSHAYRRVLYGLTQAGFATMRVEKSGIGDSEGAACNSPQVDVKRETEGYVAGLRALKTYDFVDAEKTFIFGHSIGGIVGPLVAQDVPVRGIIASETIGTNWLEYSYENYRRQAVLGDTPFDVIERNTRQNRVCKERLWFGGETPEQILKDAPECNSWLQAPASYTYMRQLVELNLGEAWKKARSPAALIIYGTSDFITSADEHTYLRDTINSYRPGTAAYVEIPQMDHYMERAATQRESFERLRSQPSVPPQFHEQFYTEILNWLKQNLGAPPTAAVVSQTPVFSAADLQNLRWLEGDWHGTENGKNDFYERYRFAGEDRIEMQSFRDRTMTEKGEDTATIFVKDGMILYRGGGSGVWAAERLSKTEIAFAPREAVSNSFVWKSESPDVWTAELIYPRPGGEPRRTIYRIERIKK